MIDNEFEKSARELIISTKDMSHQQYAGYEGSGFEMYFNRELSPGDIISRGDIFDQKMKVVEVKEEGLHIMKSLSKPWILEANLKENINFIKH